MFVFVDIETGGLPVKGTTAGVPILELAVIITDAQLEEQDARSWIIHHPKQVLEAMDPWCVRVHGESGLTEECLEADHGLEEVERQMVDYYRPLLLPDGFPERPGKNSVYGVHPMCGSSVHFDRQFIQEQMPVFNELFHYRNTDVTTLRNLFAAWGADLAPCAKKEADHRALADIRDSVKALRFYRDAYITL